jgi:DNA-binding MurR/RpiR family transcriptional regulator
MFEVEKKISDFIMAQPWKIVNMTVAELARKIGVADSSIIRFCQRLGFDGFTQLKINLAGSLRKPEELILEDIKHNDSPFEITSKVFSSSIRALTETINMLNKKMFSDAVDVISEAKRIEFYGVGTSASLAEDVYYRFMRIGLPTYASTDSHIMRISASMLDGNCAAVGISHTGRTKDTVRALEIAHSKGAKTICITSYMKSPIIEVSDIPLITSTSETKLLKEAVSSRIAHIALLDGLYACVALQKYDNTAEKLRQMTDILNEMRF